MKHTKLFEDFLNEDLAPAGFEREILVHGTNKENTPSILEDGLGASDNPVITSGIYTFPVSWDNHNTSFDKKTTDFYYIKMKPGSKILWTDADRPMDYLFGRVGKEFRPAWEKILKETGVKDEETLYYLGVGSPGWFEWKTKFHRAVEKYMIENGYDYIQEGGQIVITNLGAIESIMLNKKTPIKINKEKYRQGKKS